MKNNILFAVFLIAIAVVTLNTVALVQATLDITPPNNMLTVTHGTSFSSSFILTNSGADVTSITCTKTAGIFSMTISGCPTTLLAGQSTTVTYTGSVPLYQAASMYLHQITVNGMEIGLPITSTTSISITVPSSPALAISSSVAMLGYPGATYQSNFSLNNNGNTQLNGIVFTYSDTNMKDDENDTITLSFNPSTLDLTPGGSANIVLQASVPSTIDYGTYSTDVVAASGTVNATMHVTLTIYKKFCDSGNVGSYITISVKDPSSGEDFKPNEEITVEVSVKNNDDDERDIVLEAELFDLTDDVYVVKEEVDATITENHEETLTLKLLVPLDVESDHRLAVIVKAYEDGEEDTQCKDESVNVDVEKDSHSVIIETTKTTPETVECDGTFSAELKFGNAGRNDEKKVKVRLYNTALDIDVEKTFLLEEGEYYTAIFSDLTVPKDAEEKEYVLNIDYFYSYDSGTEDYDLSGSGEMALKVEGNCFKPVYGVMIDASSTLSAKVNQETLLKVTLTNTGNEQTIYALSASGFDGWTSANSIDVPTLTLEPQSSGSFYVKFTPTQTGSQKFTVKTTFNGQTQTKEITVDVIAASTAASWFEQIWFSMKHNWEWLVVNAILAIAIIVLLVLLLTRKGKTQKGQVMVYGGKKSEGPTEINLKEVKKKTAKKSKKR